MGGRRTAASGALSDKGDVKTDKWLAEAKQTKSHRFSITRALWAKIYREAVLSGRLPVMVIELAGVSLAVIDFNDFLAFGQE